LILVILAFLLTASAVFVVSIDISELALGCSQLLLESGDFSAKLRNLVGGVDGCVIEVLLQTRDFALAFLKRLFQSIIVVGQASLSLVASLFRFIFVRLESGDISVQTSLSLVASLFGLGLS